MKTFLKAILFIFIWGVLLGGGYVFYEGYTFLNTPASATSREIVFNINPGATFDRVAWDLKKAGVITDVPRFRLLAQYHDALGRIKAGEFLLDANWTPDKVLYQITRGQAMQYRLTIREGLTWWETARAVEEQGFATYEDFREVIHDPEFLRKHSIPFANAEGFLYPETYLLKKPRSPLDKEQARQVADVMVRMFWKKAEPLWSGLPLRPDLENPIAPSPGKPLLPARSGAMDSSASGAGGAPVEASSPSVFISSENAQAPAPALAQSYSATLADGEAPANAVTALPGASNLVQPSGLPAAKPEGGGWAATIPPASGEDIPLAGSLLPEVQNAAQSQAIEPARAEQNAVAAKENIEAPATGEQAAPSDTGAAGGQAQALPSANATIAAEEAIPGGPRSPDEVDPNALRMLITLASLVEKETGVPEERGTVAGVYANRMRLRMLLQCDPTIIYGIGPSFSGAIRRSQIDDPKNIYNTYQHPGLPPGPICSPGLLSLQAAYDPEQHEYLYFVATGIDAAHTFSKTLSEHNKAVQVYRERMRAGSGAK
jgi:conserved hypothetical protein, YceG family